MYYIFIRSSVDGHLVCFYALPIVHSAAMNTEVHVSFQIHVLGFFSNIYLGMELAGHTIILFLVS